MELTKEQIEEVTDVAGLTDLCIEGDVTVTPEYNYQFGAPGCLAVIAPNLSDAYRFIAALGAVLGAEDAREIAALARTGPTTSA